jgi:cytochrome P450
MVLIRVFLFASFFAGLLQEMIFRGTDTTAILTEWIMAELVLHPEIQAKLHSELDAVVGRNREVRDADIAHMPYLQAVVKETLRTHPPGPLLSWARLSTEDVQVGGHLVPKGTTAMVNMWAIAHDPTIWANPHNFCPERFLPLEGGMDLDVRGSDLRLAPFGAGRRVCPGRALGMTTVQLWLAQLLHKFQWVASTDHPVDLSEVLKLSCEMVHPLHAVPIPRMITDLNI